MLKQIITSVNFDLENSLSQLVKRLEKHYFYPLKFSFLVTLLPQLSVCNDYFEVGRK